MTLCKIISKVSAALERPYEELLALLPNEAVLNIDETGHKDNGEQVVDLVFASRLVHAVSRSMPARSADVLMDLLGREILPA